MGIGRVIVFLASGWCRHYFYKKLLRDDERVSASGENSADAQNDVRLPTAHYPPLIMPPPGFEPGLPP